MQTGTAFHPLGLDRPRMLELMAEQNLSGMLLTSPENVFYTSGYTALPSSGNPILYTLRNRLPFLTYADEQGSISLLCWAFSAHGVDFGADQIVGFDDLAGAHRAIAETVGDRLPGGGRLGVESTCARWVLDLLAADAGDPDLGSADAVLSELRLIKSDEEIAMIAASTELVERTVGELYDVLRPGGSRVALMREAKERLYRHGADGISHVTFSFATENPEVEIEESFDKGRLATLDLGAIVGGYCSDNRRYAYCGEIPGELQSRYDVMVGIVDEVGAALKPGTPYADLHQLAVNLFAESDIELLKRFTHVGHNIGLETEEEWIDDRADRTIQAGMVINVELYSHAATGEQIGNEETFVVQGDGPRRLSVLPREIRSIT
jgi:Xaa-Pro aminopeptidase